MNVDDYFSNNYFTFSDLSEPLAVTIEDVVEETFRDGEKPKPILLFYNQERSLPLNRTNAKTLERLSGTKEMKQWVGMVIELYTDATIKGPNGLRGGIRIRPAPQGAEPVKTPPF